MPFMPDTRSSMILSAWGAQEPLPMTEYLLFWTAMISMSSIVEDIDGCRALLYVVDANTMLVKRNASATA